MCPTYFGPGAEMRHAPLAQSKGGPAPRARYYMPEIGRFIQSDPIKFRSGDANFYAYTSSSPIQNIDPTGLDTWSGAVDTVGGFAFIYGRSTSYGWLTNWETGEKCYVEVNSNKLGVGLGGGVTASAIFVYNGPARGVDLNGYSASFAIEGGAMYYGTAAEAGAAGGQSTYSQIGAGFGMGAAIYAQLSTTCVMWCECAE